MTFIMTGTVHCNKGTVEVTGAVVNRGAGYGMEVPCKYRLYGIRAYVECVIP